MEPLRQEAERLPKQKAEASAVDTESLRHKETHQQSPSPGAGESVQLCQRQSVDPRVHLFTRFHLGS